MSNIRLPARQVGLACLWVGLWAAAFVQAGDEQPAPAEAIPALRVEKVSDSCYAVLQGEGRANAGFVVGKDSVLLIDCLGSPDRGAELLAAIRKVTDRPLAGAVLTHWHYDHTVGDQALPSGTRILASPAAAQALARRLKADRLLLSPASGMHGSVKIRDVREANDLVEGEREIDLGGVKAKLIVVGDCHTEGDLIVYVEAEKVLFSGDLVWNRCHPNIGEGSTFKWISALAYLDRLAIDRLVPGHGEVAAKEAVAEQRQYLMNLRRLVKHLAKNDVKAETIVSQLGVPEAWADYALAVYWPANVRFVYEELVRGR